MRANNFYSQTPLISNSKQLLMQNNKNHFKISGTPQLSQQMVKQQQRQNSQNESTMNNVRQGGYSNAYLAHLKSKKVAQLRSIESQILPIISRRAAPIDSNSSIQSTIVKRHTLPGSKKIEQKSQSVSHIMEAKNVNYQSNLFNLINDQNQKRNLIDKNSLKANQYLTQTQNYDNSQQKLSTNNVSRADSQLKHQNTDIQGYLSEPIYGNLESRNVYQNEVLFDHQHHQGTEIMVGTSPSHLQTQDSLLLQEINDIKKQKLSSIIAQKRSSNIGYQDNGPQKLIQRDERKSTVQQQEMRLKKKLLIQQRQLLLPKDRSLKTLLSYRQPESSPNQYHSNSHLQPKQQNDYQILIQDPDQQPQQPSLYNHDQNYIQDNKFLHKFNTPQLNAKFMSKMSLFDDSNINTAKEQQERKQFIQQNDDKKTEFHQINRERCTFNITSSSNQNINKLENLIKNTTSDSQNNLNYSNLMKSNIITPFGQVQEQIQNKIDMKVTRQRLRDLNHKIQNKGGQYKDIMRYVLHQGYWKYKNQHFKHSDDNYQVGNGTHVYKNMESRWVDNNSRSQTQSQSINLQDQDDNYKELDSSAMKSYRSNTMVIEQNILNNEMNLIDINDPSKHHQPHKLSLPILQLPKLKLINNRTREAKEQQTAVNIQNIDKFKQQGL
eukprot:403349486